LAQASAAARASAGLPTTSGARQGGRAGGCMGRRLLPPPGVAAAAACFLGSHFASCISVDSSRYSLAAAKHVECEVCRLAVNHAHRYADEHKIHGLDALQDLTERVCKVKKPEGRWLNRLDVYQLEDDPSLTIDVQKVEGECNEDCLTVQRACNMALDNREEELARLIENNARPTQFRRSFCQPSCTGRKLPSLKGFVDTEWKPRRAHDKGELLKENVRQATKESIWEAGGARAWEKQMAEKTEQERAERRKKRRRRVHGEDDDVEL